MGIRGLREAWTALCHCTSVSRKELLCCVCCELGWRGSFAEAQWCQMLSKRKDHFPLLPAPLKQLCRSVAVTAMHVPGSALLELVPLLQSHPELWKAGSAPGHDLCHLHSLQPRRESPQPGWECSGKVPCRAGGEAVCSCWECGPAFR